MGERSADGPDDDGRSAADGEPPGPGPSTGEEAPPWKQPEDEWTRPEEDDEEMHPVLDVLADVSLYLAVGSFGLSVVGLAALGLQYRIPGRSLVTVGIAGATVAMLLATIIGALSEEFSPFERPSRSANADDGDR